MLLRMIQQVINRRFRLGQQFRFHFGTGAFHSLAF